MILSIFFSVTLGIFLIPQFPHFSCTFYVEISILSSKVFFFITSTMKQIYSKVSLSHPTISVDHVPPPPPFCFCHCTPLCNSLEVCVGYTFSEFLNFLYCLYFDQLFEFNLARYRIQIFHSRCPLLNLSFALRRGYLESPKVMMAEALS